MIGWGVRKINITKLMTRYYFRWSAVDPMADDYTWWTSYQYTGNMPVKYIDLDGLEPANNPKSPENQDGRNPTNVINEIYKKSGGDGQYIQNAKKYGAGIFLEDKEIEGLTLKSGFTTDNQTANDANKYNTWVNSKGVLYASDIENFDQKELINYLMGNFVNGKGPENIIFPTNGAASLTLKNSGIANEAITKLLEKNLDFISLNVGGNMHNPPSIVNNGFLAIETFLGSASVSVSRTTNKELFVQIFNITSLTSGDYYKHWLGYNWTQSVVRSNNGSNKYGNISQTFSYTIKDPNTY